MKGDFWNYQAAITLLTYILAVGFLAILAVVVMKLMSDKISLSGVLEEKDGTGKASISRFQLLVFTLVIAGLYLLLSLEAGTLIDVPNGALALLGLSGGSFLVSKGIGTPAGRNPGGGAAGPGDGKGGNPPQGQ